MIVDNNESFSTFINEIKDTEYDPNDSIMESLWSQYERVVIESIISSFGLGMFIEDQAGGDVDTIKNVRDINKNRDFKNKIYKNTKYNELHNAMPEYKTLSDDFHKLDKNYNKFKDIMDERQVKGTLKDIYTGKKIDVEADYDLEHIISAKEIYEDEARILSGLNPLKLANSKNNFRATDDSINRSKSHKSAIEFNNYINENKEQWIEKISKLKEKDKLTDNEKKELDKLESLVNVKEEKLLEIDKHVRKNYNKKLVKNYYFNKKNLQFYKDTLSSSAKLGVKVGLRQVYGFCFCEIWFAIKDELNSINDGCSWNDLFTAINNGIKNGINNIEKNYKELFNKFGFGGISGITASLSTTLTNIFFTTSKNLVKNIRLSSTFVIQSGNIILFNPDDLDLGQRLKEASIVIITGASVIVGSAVGESLRTTPVATIPEVGDIIISFISALASGIMSCTILCFLDRSKTIKQLLYLLDKIPTEVNNYKEIAEYMEQYYAILEKYDFDKFKKEINSIHNITDNINKINSDDELHKYLLEIYDELKIPKPWTGDINSFMSNKENHLQFS